MVELTANKFYESVSEFYDEMTTFKDRFKNEYKIMEGLASHFGFKKVLDAACGTGIHAIALSKLGVLTKGIDLSPKMIDKAESNARVMQTNTEFQVLPVQNTLSLGSNVFDTILFLGNSLPHILNNEELLQIFNSFAQILMPDGTLIIQLLNYEKILKDKERVVSVKKQGSVVFIRFYDFLENNVRFNLLSIDQESDPIKHNIYSTLLKPYQTEEIAASLEPCGFQSIKLYGSLKFAAFDPLQSGNLVLVAKTK